MASMILDGPRVALRAGAGSQRPRVGSEMKTPPKRVLAQTFHGDRIAGAGRFA